ncbi:MAG: PIN domain-containing protein [Deltaproteobacteria bacterium]|nr:PIN domain-containing protein [Deltaproteobacteria bacterium]MBF0508757.1 PIN domain-containing protein [Deltaproteobacteria bacterium]MBF0524857.1 PIN domain-containing protein [Deltaproteobacteria bacterium]
MRKYLLDSNIISYLYDAKSPFRDAIKKNLTSVAEEDEVVVSILTIYEHYYGMAKAESANDADLVERLEKACSILLKKFPILPLSIAGAKEFGKLKDEYRKILEKVITKKKDLKKHLERKSIDLMLAGSAIAENAIFVSNDEIFETIKEMRPDFRLENWTR